MGKPIKALYDEELTRTDTYLYSVNQGGELNIRVETHEDNIQIIFINGKFKECRYDFKQMYTRTHWHILGGIADKITELENRYRGEGWQT